MIFVSTCFIKWKASKDKPYLFKLEQIVVLRFLVWFYMHMNLKMY